MFRDKYKCRICGSIRYLESHHLVLLFYNGKDTAENVVTLCWFCHHNCPDNPSLTIELMKNGMDIYSLKSMLRAENVLRSLFGDVGKGNENIKDLILANFAMRFRVNYAMEQDTFNEFYKEDNNKLPLSSGCTNNQSDGEINGS